MACSGSDRVESTSFRSERSTNEFSGKGTLGRLTMNRIPLHGRSALITPK